MPQPGRKSNFDRALRIAGYNWPLYAIAGTVVLLGVILAALPLLPAWGRWLCGGGAFVAAWFAFASFGAFHWMFDRSELLSGQWLNELSPVPSRWVQVSVGLEETTLPIEAVFPAAEGKSLDLFHPALMSEPAVTRARHHKASVLTEYAKPESLPVEHRWADLVVVTLAAHEIRSRPVRVCFFQELRRIAAPGARIVIVEHLRDWAAALAFGGGIFHFFPRGEWLSLGRQIGLELVQERSITPFIQVFVYEAGSDGTGDDMKALGVAEGVPSGRG